MHPHTQVQMARLARAERARDRRRAHRAAARRRTSRSVREVVRRAEVGERLARERDELDGLRQNPAAEGAGS